MPKETEDRDLITRRAAILRVSALLGGVALVGQGALLAGCERRVPTPEAGGTADAGASPQAFGKDAVALLDELTEAILPETDTPGAKAAGVGPFVAKMVTDCYAPREQQVFREGLATVDDRCRAMHDVAFLAATPEQRLALAEKLDAEQMQYMHGLEEDQPAHWFRMLKELTLLGYFTSEIGYEQALRYAETPGRYDPCVPYAPGEKAWADHA